MGERSRGQDHRDAADLIRRITPGGGQAARDLGRLLSLKDAAQYGLDETGGPALVAAQRQAKTLIAFAEQVVTA